MELFLRAGLGNAMMATILALGAASAGCWLRHRPAVRHALWLLVLLKLVTPPLWIVPLARHEPTASHIPPRIAPVVEPMVESELGRAAVPPVGLDRISENHWFWNRLQLTLGPVVQTRLAIVWLMGSALSLIVTGVRIRRWRKLQRFIEPAPDDVQDGVDLLAEALGITRPPRAYWFPGAAAPMLWAFGCRARLIVPSKLWDRLDNSQRTTLLVHELAHLRRKDHWVRIVELLATVFYWWLPPAWIARWALREAEEQCCDAWVVWTCPDAHRAYAETLLDTVDFLSETGLAVPSVASGFGQAHHLKRRVTMIMQGRTPRGLSWSGLLVLFGLAALLLPLSPTWAQKADDEEPPRKKRVVREKVDDSKESEIDGIYRKLDQQLRRLRSIQKRALEKERASVKEEGDRPKERDVKPEASERDQKANVTVLSVPFVRDGMREAKQRDQVSDRKQVWRFTRQDADRESAERDDDAKGKDKREDRRVVIKRDRTSPSVRVFEYRRESDPKKRTEDARATSEEARATSTDRTDVAKELVRAKLELERTRAQLRHAELQLERLRAEMEAKQGDTDHRPTGPKDKEKTKPKESPESDLKPEAQLRKSNFDAYKDALFKKVETAPVGRIIEKIHPEEVRETKVRALRKIGVVSPENKKRIAELEALREKYAESLDQVRAKVRDVDHDPAARFISTKLESVKKKLQALENDLILEIEPEETP